MATMASAAVRRRKAEKKRAEEKKKKAEEKKDKAERKKAEREKAEKDKAERKKAEREKAEKEKAEEEMAERKKAEEDAVSNIWKRGAEITAREKKAEQGTGEGTDDIPTSLRPLVLPLTTSPISKIPEDILLMIADRLPLASAASLALTSKTNYRILGQGTQSTNRLRFINKNDYTSLDIQEYKCKIEENKEEDPAHVTILPTISPWDLGHPAPRGWKCENVPDVNSAQNTFFSLLSRDDSTKHVYCWYCKTFHDPEITMTFQDLRRQNIPHARPRRPCVKVFQDERLSPCTGIGFPFIAVQDLMRQHRLGNTSAVKEKMKRMEKLTVRRRDGQISSLKTEQKFQIVDNTLFTKRRHTMILPLKTYNSERGICHFEILREFQLCMHVGFDDVLKSSYLTQSDRCEIRHYGRPSENACVGYPFFLKPRQCDACEGNMEYQVAGRLTEDDQFAIIFTVWQRLGKGHDPFDEWSFTSWHVSDSMHTFYQGWAPVPYPVFLTL
ncbi:hypothetical protein NHQ30_002812 [Ciborinia camelliae]|nr:hypothetical protein NHQ30_002812 [Ciborinia camelliae]